MEKKKIELSDNNGLLRLAGEVEEEENGIEARREGSFGNEKRPAIAVPAKNRRQTHF